MTWTGNGWYSTGLYGDVRKVYQQGSVSNGWGNFITSTPTFVINAIDQVHVGAFKTDTTYFRQKVFIKIALKKGSFRLTKLGVWVSTFNTPLNYIEINSFTEFPMIVYQIDSLPVGSAAMSLESNNALGYISNVHVENPTNMERVYIELDINPIKVSSNKFITGEDGYFYIMLDRIGPTLEPNITTFVDSVLTMPACVLTPPEEFGVGGSHWSFYIQSGIGSAEAGPNKESGFKTKNKYGSG
jgi:hypothetical protein